MCPGPRCGCLRLRCGRFDAFPAQLVRVQVQELGDGGPVQVAREHDDLGVRRGVPVLQPSGVAQVVRGRIGGLAEAEHEALSVRQAQREGEAILGVEHGGLGGIQR